MKPSEFLNKNNPLTREEMQQFLEGKLSQSERKKVEEKFIDDDFASEAAEGYTQTNVGFGALSSVNAAWEKKTQSLGSKSINYKYWFIGSSVVAVIAILSMVVLMTSKEEVKENNLAENKPLDENDPNNYPQHNANFNRDQYGQKPVVEGNYWNSEESGLSDAQLKKEIKDISASQPIEKSKQITYEKTVASQPETVSEIKPEVKEIAIDPVIVEGKDPQEIATNDAKKVVESNVKMLYIKNLKAVDYSDFYTNHIAKKEWILTGTTADKETSASEGVVNEQVTTYIPYKDFLTETLTKFSKNDFKGTLKGLLIILQQYPDDLNASFYSGLCYYNLGKNEQAIAMFDKAIGNSITTFREESEWYKCLSLIENGERNEAKTLLKKIGDENGFYGKSAREKLKNMK